MSLSVHPQTFRDDPGSERSTHVLSTSDILGLERICRLVLTLSLTRGFNAAKVG